jgi:hypothetical protein
MHLDGKQDGKSNPFPKELFKAGDLLPDPVGQNVFPGSISGFFASPDWLCIPKLTEPKK